MRTMAKALGLLLVIAFVAGVWDARYDRDDRPAAGSPAGFRTAPLARRHPVAAAPELVEVRTLRQDGYDRVEFHFREALPGYAVRYVPRVTDQGGRRLPVPGPAFLTVAFEPARAHDPGGEPTFAPATLNPGSPRLRQVRLAGDFEGRVVFGLGVAGRGGFRVVELRDPARLAVDIR
jgi:hypothetical protein